MIEKVVQRHYPSNFSCRGKLFRYKNLVAATIAACPLTKGIARNKFPARFDGPNFINHGKKRYIHPIFENKLYVEGKGKRERHYHLDYNRTRGNSLTLRIEPGIYRLMMNSACKLVGVVMIDENSNYEECDIHNFSISQLYK